MKRVKLLALLVALIFIEMVALSFVLASNLPYRRSELAAFSRYTKEPTDINRELWLKERQVMEREVLVGKVIGVLLAAVSGFYIVRTAKELIRGDSRAPAGEH